MSSRIHRENGILLIAWNPSPYGGFHKDNWLRINALIINMLLNSIRYLLRYLLRYPLRVTQQVTQRVTQHFF
ncbi:MAG: hypothetical protein IJ562_06025 [Prevotella sp.]|nr:hypothetical protein [Prevotella sp.]